MARLVDLVNVLRSKNSGPFQITFDLFFPDDAVYRRVLDSGVIAVDRIAALYELDASKVQLIPSPQILA